MKPIVSIVGRPNVGKSTLFNRIIRRREAIVDDEPGITRDRKAADASWEGVDFTLVDTGGYIPKTLDVIEAGVTRQVNLAIEEADLIVFLTDVATGITDVDDEVARLIRKGQKPCVVAVNKVDSAKQESDAAAFIKLGLGEPISISAMRGLAIGDLLSLIIEKLGPVENEEAYPADTLKLAVVGKPNVGKSTFVNCILGEERVLVTDIPGTTRDAVDVRFKFGNQDMVLIDTAGIRRRTKVKESVEYYSGLRTTRVIERCDVAAVFVGADEGVTSQDMRVLKMVVDAGKGVLLVLNKWDLLKGDKVGQQSIELNLDLKMQGLAFIPVVSISSLTRLRVEKVLTSMVKIFNSQRTRVGSPELNRLVEHISRIQHPSIKGKRIRLMYGSQVAISPPKFVFFSNHPDLIREDYSRYIENQIREQFGFEGVPIVITFKHK